MAKAILAFVVEALDGLGLESELTAVGDVDGIGDDDEEGLEVATGRGTPLSQTSFLLTLMHVYFLPRKTIF